MSSILQVLKTRRKGKKQVNWWKVANTWLTTHPRTTARQHKLLNLNQITSGRSMSELETTRYAKKVELQSRSGANTQPVDLPIQSVTACFYSSLACELSATSPACNLSAPSRFNLFSFSLCKPTKYFKKEQTLQIIYILYHQPIPFYHIILSCNSILPN
jgi:hypothetical protein